MMLSLLARSSGRPSGQTILGTLAGASFTVWLICPPQLRDALWARPVIVAGMATITLTWVLRSLLHARRTLTMPGQNPQDRWPAALSELVPKALVRLATAELTILHMALFRWSGPADIPEKSRAFAYHRHLTPICATLLILSAIEITTYHLVIGHWNHKAAIAMFLISDVGFVYLLGLIKSFRFRPVLLTAEGIRVRTGFLIDRLIPFAAVATVETNFPGETIRDPATLNAALLAWPNVLLRLKEPLPRRSLCGKQAPIRHIAFRLDEPGAFLQLLHWRLGQHAA
ncbi:hypothetical protein [Novosphingobium terrae]|uniref:hypothetical protein n=1 Tax=Novosphingobium terrae TaxID=2726189 RepID=UPI001980A212|nr:hypothetical protein [Novosphingobium terrae]